MNDRKLAFSAIINDLDIILCQIILLVIILLTAVQVVLRFVFSAPLDWPEELSAILLIWLTFIGAVALTRRNDHIRVELVEEFAGPRVARWFDLFFEIATVVFLALIVVGGWDLINQLTFERTPALRIHINLIVAIVPVTAVIMIVSYLISIVRNLLGLVGGGRDGD